MQSELKYYIDVDGQLLTRELRGTCNYKFDDVNHFFTSQGMFFWVEATDFDEKI